MLYTLENVRDNLRTREGRRVFFLGATDTLTSAARDFLAEQRIPILPAAEAKITRYETGDGGFFEDMRGVRRKPDTQAKPRRKK